MYFLPIVWARRRTPTTDPAEPGRSQDAHGSPRFLSLQAGARTLRMVGAAYEVGDKMAEPSRKHERPGSATGEASRIDDGRRAGGAFE